ncbi:MAG TPA: hypothetical protein O0X27_01785 [Methanocorpusculum sp.]|nr:hypothetical protein [Methanocorpusculum sp.]
MTEEIEEQNLPAEEQAAPTQRVVKPLPSRGLIIGATIAGVATLVLSLITLILHYMAGSAEIVRTVFWWASWVVLIIDVIFTFITTSKKYRPSKNIAIAGMCGLIGAVMLLVVAFLGK